MIRKEWPDINEVKRRVHYDRKNGVLRYRPRPFSDFEHMKRNEVMWKMWNTRFAGKRWGSISKSGHMKGDIDGSEVYAHHVVWALETGSWPDFQVNHIDGDPQNNRFKNLRYAEQSQVAKNQSLHRDNTSGVSGVQRRKDTGKWTARIETSKGTKYLGCFESKDDAVEARRLAEAQYGYHVNHGKRPSRFTEPGSTS